MYARDAMVLDAEVVLAGRHGAEISRDRRRRLAGIGSLAWAIVASLAAVSAVAFGNGVPPSYIYGIDDNNVLWVMNLDAQTSGTLFQTNLTGQSNGLAYNNVREELFAVDGNNDLYWWKQGATNFSLIASGSAFGIGSGSENQPWGAAYYDSAYWFFKGSGNATDTLLGSNVLQKVSIDYSGATPTVSGFVTYTVPQITGSNAFGDIAITPQGKLYAYTHASNPGQLYSLDLATIESGSTGYQLINTTSGTGLQIAFNPDYSVLYGHNFTDGKWYTVNTTTGDLTPVGSFTTTPVNNEGFRDLGGSSVQAVPEPSTMALAAMGVGIVAWQMCRRRKRQQGLARLGVAAACGLVAACFATMEPTQAAPVGHDIVAGHGSGAVGAVTGRGGACALQCGRLDVTNGRYAAFLSIVRMSEPQAREATEASPGVATALASAPRPNAFVSRFDTETNAMVGGSARAVVRTASLPLTRREDFSSATDGFADLDALASGGLRSGGFDRIGNGSTSTDRGGASSPRYGTHRISWVEADASIAPRSSSALRMSGL